MPYESKHFVDILLIHARMDSTMGFLLQKAHLAQELLQNLCRHSPGNPCNPLLTAFTVPRTSLVESLTILSIHVCVKRLVSMVLRMNFAFWFFNTSIESSS